ncbi:unnamed protein product, partial [Phaeothamnion confervicola]
RHSCGCCGARPAPRCRPLRQGHGKLPARARPDDGRAPDFGPLCIVALQIRDPHDYKRHWGGREEIRLIVGSAKVGEEGVIALTPCRAAGTPGYKARCWQRTSSASRTCGRRRLPRFLAAVRGRQRQRCENAF